MTLVEWIKEMEEQLQEELDAYDDRCDTTLEIEYTTAN